VGREVVSFLKVDSLLVLISKQKLKVSRRLVDPEGLSKKTSKFGLDQLSINKSGTNSWDFDQQSF
jgi:hypothetical protein